MQLMSNMQNMYLIALNSFAQQSGGFLAQGMHHHSELDMWPLIRANALFLDPVFVCCLGCFTRSIDCVAIVDNVSGYMPHTVNFSCCHERMIMFILEWEDDETLFLISK